jgi:DNA-directed RNA polymerase beta' subunit
MKNYTSTNPTNLSKWVVRLEFNKYTMALKYVSMEDVVVSLMASFKDIFVIPSTDYIRIYVPESELMKIADVEKYIIETYIHTVLGTYVKGVPLILDARVSNSDKYVVDNETGDFKKVSEYIINTVGSNHMGLMDLTKFRDFVDVDQLLTNDIVETMEIFGIEAARTRAIDQMIESMEGRKIAYAHLSIYADTLTWSGDLVPLEKSILREKNKTLLRASWNYASKNLSDGANIGAYEEATNITSSVMLGNTPKIGTHYSSILIDEDVILAQTRKVIDVINAL